MKLKFFGYFIFIAATIIFSLNVHFPRKATAKYIERFFSQLNAQVKLQIDDVDPSFPSGIKIDSIQVSYSGMPIATLTNFKSSLDLTTVFDKKTMKGFFKTDVFDGFLSGSALISKVKPRQIDIETKIENLNLKNIHLGKFLLDCNFSGILNGTIDAEFNQGHMMKNHGEVKLADITLQFPETIFPVETFSFSNGNIKFVVPQHNIIRIEEFLMKGRQVDIISSGEIRVNENFQRSTLNLNARLVLYPLFFMNAGANKNVNHLKRDSDNAIINLRIGGTIQNPTISMEQKSK